MNKEFKILNKKLDVLFDELLWLRRDLQRDKTEKEIKELEYKVKDSQKDLEFKKEDSRFFHERIDERRRFFMNIEREFGMYEKYEQTVEEVKK